MAQPNPLWDVIQHYLDSPTHRYAPKVADISRESGVSDQVFSKWKSRPTLPTTTQMARVSEATGIPYVKLLVAALRGKGYLPPDGGLFGAELGQDAPDQGLLREWLDRYLFAQNEIDEALKTIADREVLICDLLEGGIGASGLDPRSHEDARKAHRRATDVVSRRPGAWSYHPNLSEGGGAHADSAAPNKPPAPGPADQPGDVVRRLPKAGSKPPLYSFDDEDEAARNEDDEPPRLGDDL